MLTSPYSFAASANCFLYEGGTPVFADIDRRTLNLDPAAVEAVVTERTKAIVAVDIYGYPCEPIGRPRYSAPSASHASSISASPCRSASLRSSSSSQG